LAPQHAKPYTNASIVSNLSIISNATEDNRLYLEIFCMHLTLSFSDTLLLFFAPYRRVCSSKWGSIIEKIQNSMHTKYS